jgi:hypothetical protein
MHASGQNDTTVVKDSSRLLLIPNKTVKDLPPFSYHMLLSYKLPNTVSGFYGLRNYQNAHSNVFLKNKWEAPYELVGYTVLSLLGENNGYIYNFTRPR